MQTEDGYILDSGFTFGGRKALIAWFVSELSNLTNEAQYQVLDKLDRWAGGRDLTRELVEQFRAEMEFAWLHLTRLSGCNYKQPAERKGRWLFVRNPHNAAKRYRLDAATFDAGRAQFRDSWAIGPWDSRAEQTTTDEANWQT